MPHKNRAAAHAYREANRAHINGQRRQRYAKNPERTLAPSREYQAKHRLAITARRRYRKFGTDGEAQYAAQQGLCAICGGAMVRRARRTDAAHFDHDHKTGKPRGWLCSRCNLGIGLFGDDDVLLQKAVNYLMIYKP